MCSVCLHAATHINSQSRKRLYQLIEYQARPPITPRRLEILSDGQIKLRLKTPYTDGTTHLIMQPFEFLSRLKSLIPPRGQNQVLYFGVFAPSASDRESFRLGAGARKKSFYRPKPPPAAGELPPPQPRPMDSSSWTRHLKRTFQVDVSRCSRFGADMRIKAVIQDSSEIARYLDHVQGYQRAPPEAAEPKLPASRVVEFLVD